MERFEHSDDRRAIEALIARQFASLGWSPGRSPDWEAFAADFFAGAPLYPAARPARRQTVDGFVERMKGLAGTKLRSFAETVLGTDVHVFGNVAVALAACEITENDADVSRGVEALLLVKDEGRWRIVAQAWTRRMKTNRFPSISAAGCGVRADLAPSPLTQARPPSGVLR
jgi:ketosteroid isomerase-like protein